MRVNTSLLAINIEDSWLLYKGTRNGQSLMTPNEFYSQLADGLIENTFGIRTGNSQEVINREENTLRSGIGPHLTVGNRKRKRSNGSDTNSWYQGRCKVCRSGKKSKYVCSHCTLENNSEFYVCHPSTHRNCFSDHLNSSH